MPKVIFRAIKESVMASKPYGREANLREGSFESSGKAQQPETRGPQAPSNPPMESAATAHGSSVIGPRLVFRGKLTAEEDLLIQGRVEGSIHHSGTNLTIGAQGEVKADIVARKVVIQGAVQGDVRASDSITVEASARVQGNLFAARVAIKEGAQFKGAIDMDVAAGEAALRGHKVDELLGSVGS
jgi:cytoskeletal protein CcmA (bactofilin family)